jgi:hypothetical protein
MAGRRKIWCWFSEVVIARCKIVGSTFDHWRPFRPRTPRLTYYRIMNPLRQPKPLLGDCTNFNRYSDRDDSLHQKYYEAMIDLIDDDQRGDRLILPSRKFRIRILLQPIYFEKNSPSETRSTRLRLTASIPLALGPYQTWDPTGHHHFWRSVWVVVGRDAAEGATAARESA